LRPIIQAGAMASLRGRSIVIVGGTTGLGLSAARACLAEGANLIVVGRDPQRADEARQVLGSEARVLVGDARDSTTAEQAVAQAVQAHGRLDGLYHVAGGSGRAVGDGPLDQIPDEGWDATLRLNLDSLFYSNRAAARQMLAQGGGSVLNMASVLGHYPAPKHFATHAYAAAKAAIVGLTRACAAFYAPHNIRFNAIAPGLIETPMSRRAAGDAEILAYVAARQPLDGGRIGRPEDLDAAVLYLLSDAARFVTGQVLAVDGGWSVCDAG
jgi:NAD(P)-dependent dehydrogenase (short-subunit alcohol dehydrogenase family)